MQGYETGAGGPPGGDLRQEGLGAGKDAERELGSCRANAGAGMQG